MMTDIAKTVRAVTIVDGPPITEVNGHKPATSSSLYRM